MICLGLLAQLPELATVSEFLEACVPEAVEVVVLGCHHGVALDGTRQLGFTGRLQVLEITEVVFVSKECVDLR